MKGSNVGSASFRRLLAERYRVELIRTVVPVVNVSSRILLVENEEELVKGLQGELLTAGYEVATTARGDEGLALASENGYAAVVTAWKIPGLSGLELIQHLHRTKPWLPIILMTGYGTSDTAIEAIRLGAYEYLRKPFKAAELIELISRAVERSQRILLNIPRSQEAFGGEAAIIGQSRAMADVYRGIGLAAQSNRAVLIRGETGTGKELVARALHHHSNRACKPFIAVNCTAIPEGLLESELFGHERGAFTGAHTKRIGHFEVANEGTLFLDEIGDLSLNNQVKLLRVLQEKRIRRLGGNEIIPVDLRIVAATHRDLERAMKEGEFRNDLFYRLCSLSIRVPPLRERLEDIPELAREFVRRAALEMGLRHGSIQPATLQYLQRLSWPGNVRELENALHHALLLAGEEPIGLHHVEKACVNHESDAIRNGHTIANYLTELLGRAERGELQDVRAHVLAELDGELFRLAMKLAAGNRSKVSRLLGVTRGTIRQKLSCLGMNGNGRSVLPPES